MGLRSKERGRGGAGISMSFSRTCPSELISLHQVLPMKGSITLLIVLGAENEAFSTWALGEQVVSKIEEAE